MEFVLAIGQTLATAASSAGAETAATAATTAATTAGAAAEGASVLSTFRTGFTVFQGLSAIAAGSAQASQMKQQAQIANANAVQAEITGAREQNDLTDNLVHTLAAQRVALSSAGVDYAAGAAAQIFDPTLSKSDRQRTESALDTAVRARSDRLSARGLMIGASNAMASGLIQAGGDFASALDRRAQRG